jgi:hypothetical protein
MSGKLASQVTITKNGTLLRTLPKGEVYLGGEKRKIHMGGNGKPTGYTVEYENGHLKATGQLGVGEKLSDFSFEDATVIATLNTGQKILFRDALTLVPPKWGSGDGEVELEIGSASGNPEEL